MDLTNFRKYKIAYLAVILLAAVIVAVKVVPFCNKVFIDISLEPPENLRKTDFNWITINEWFATQIHFIKGDAVLDRVKSKIDKDRLKKIISVKRLGLSNIMRISVCSSEDPEGMRVLIADIAGIYLKELNNSTAEEKRPYESRVQDLKKKSNETLREDIARLKDKLDRVNEHLSRYEIELKKLPANRLKVMQERLGEVDNALISVNAELADMMIVYTENWPPAARLKSRAEALRDEKAKIEAVSPDAQRIEDRRADVTGRVDAAKKYLQELQLSLKDAEQRLVQEKITTDVKNQDILKKETPYGRIINTSAHTFRKTFSALVIRITVAVAVGLALWFLLGLILRKAYLFKALKARIFKNK